MNCASNRACYVCQGYQECHTQYNPQEPVVRQGLQESNNSQKLQACASSIVRKHQTRTLFGDPPRPRYSSRIFFFISYIKADVNDQEQLPGSMAFSTGHSRPHWKPYVNGITISTCDAG